MLPHKKGKYLTKEDMLHILGKVNQDLEGFQTKPKLYCLGGTYLVLTGKRESSKDIDFIVSHKDFKTLCSSVPYIEQEEKIRFDLFSDGFLPNFQLPNYETSEKLFSFKNLEVYKLNMLDLVLTKAIAGRDEDYDDIQKIVKDKNLVPKEKLIQRFETIKIEKGKEKEVKRKFNNFINEFYK